MQVKTLMRLQKSNAGGNEELIIYFMWPYKAIIIQLSSHFIHTYYTTYTFFQVLNYFGLDSIQVRRYYMFFINENAARIQLEIHQRQGLRASQNITSPSKYNSDFDMHCTYLHMYQDLR